MSQEIFESVPLKRPKRSNFNLSHEVKGTTDGGIITPIIVRDVLPGDKWSLRTELLMKAQTLSAPIMHEVNIFTHFFFVPLRLIWDDVEEFLTGGEDGLQKPVWPTLKFYGFSSSNREELSPGSLLDYLGFPCSPTGGYGVGNGVDVDALPIRAYHLIWNEYFRDQNLQDPVEFSTASGLQNVTVGDPLLKLHYRCWRKDYFTSALPFAQRGPDVRLPIDASASLGTGTVGTVKPGTYDGFRLTSGNTGTPISAVVEGGKFENSTVFGRDASGTDGVVESIDGQLVVSDGVSNDKQVPVQGNGSDIPVSVTGPTINEVRRSVRAQEFFERQARGGGRYKETIFNQFGVVTPDARLNRPEYLGGGVQPLVVNELLQTSQTTASSPQGTQSGNVVSLGTTPQFRRFFSEHGLIIGLMSIVPKSTYQQGMPRMFSRRDRFDVAWPVLANIGEQEIKQGELYFDGNSPVSNDKTFGYVPRYAEYKYIPSSVHGEFISSMSYWHLGRIFSKSPGLNGDFVSVLPQDFDRIFPVDSQAGGKTNPGRFYYQLYFHCRAKRALPKFGVPTL